MTSPAGAFGSNQVDFAGKQIALLGHGQQPVETRRRQQETPPGHGRSRPVRTASAVIDRRDKHAAHADCCADTEAGSRAIASTAGDRRAIARLPRESRGMRSHDAGLRAGANRSQTPVIGGSTTRQMNRIVAGAASPGAPPSRRTTAAAAAGSMSPQSSLAADQHPMRRPHDDPGIFDGRQQAPARIPRGRRDRVAGIAGIHRGTPARLRTDDARRRQTASARQRQPTVARGVRDRQRESGDELPPIWSGLRRFAGARRSMPRSGRRISPSGSRYRK